MTPPITSGSFVVHPPPSGHVFVPIDSSYSLVFDDEFNGTSVNTTLWDIVDNGTIGQDSNAIAANNVVQNGFLRQQITNVPSGGKNWSGAMIFQWTDTFQPNGWLFGYFETRVKFPGPPGTIKGTEAAVWMNHLDAFPENDIAEIHGSTSAIFQTAFMNPDQTSGFGFNSGPQTNFDPYAAFHVYGMLWTPQAMTFYVDGRQTCQFLDGQTYTINGLGSSFTFNVDTSTPQYMIIWNMISTASSGTPDGSSVFPYNFYIDYLHIYQQGGAPVTPQPNYGGPGDAIGSGNNPGF